MSATSQHRTWQDQSRQEPARRDHTRTHRSWRTTIAVVGAAAVASGLAIMPSGIAVGHELGEAQGVAITQTNLISDQVGKAALVDPSLINPWGMSFGTGTMATPVWVSDNGADVATLYRGATTPPSLTKVPLTVAIPGGEPTGQVFNPSATEFTVKNGDASGVAKFIFASEAGWITGWNPNVHAAGSTMAQPAAHVADAVFKGLALASANGADYLFAADFHNNKIQVFNTSFTLQNWKDAFRDSQIPRGYAPFNIQLLNGNLYVTYAKQDADRHDDVAGPGHGFVDVYSTAGVLEQRLLKRGALNSPWGLAVAPSAWGHLAGMLLVGNFGDGRIHAYDPMTGKALGAIVDSTGHAVVIDGLWGLMPGNGVAGNADQVIFSAGPDHEAHGLVGILTAMVRADHSSG